MALDRDVDVEECFSVHKDTFASSDLMIIWETRALGEEDQYFPQVLLLPNMVQKGV